MRSPLCPGPVGLRADQWTGFNGASLTDMDTVINDLKARCEQLKAGGAVETKANAPAPVADFGGAVPLHPEFLAGVVMRRTSP